jgi:hypothetical protein
MLAKKYNIRPWEQKHLTAKDLQDLALASHAENYIKQEQMNQSQRGGMKSKRNTDSYQEYKDNMREQFGGIQ